MTEFNVAKTVVEADAVRKVFETRDLVALETTDFSIRHGEFISIIGPSGCGKSTLLKIMAGLLAPTEGEIRLDGTAITGPREDIGIMFQQATLLPWLNALENILLPFTVREGSRAAKSHTRRARDLLKLVGLESFETAYPHELSGGMAQRVAICRMLVAQPSLLLLDEPFGALDEFTREFMNEELQRICIDTEATAVMVTHSISEAVFMADTVYVMSARPGRIVKKISVPLPKRRTIDITMEPEFTDVVREVRATLDGAQA